MERACVGRYARTAEYDNGEGLEEEVGRGKGEVARWEGVLTQSIVCDFNLIQAELTQLDVWGKNGKRHRAP
jgi:hypothetical protein